MREMKKYYIIRADGSSLFELPYPEDFIYHCLFLLLDKTDERFTLLEEIKTDKLAAVLSQQASRSNDVTMLVPPAVLHRP